MSTGESQLVSLSPSQRVHVITEIARRLGNEEWSLIDMTLRQFRLNWTDDWHGNDRASYVIEMIERAGDTRYTGAELLVTRSDPGPRKLGLTTWRGKWAWKQDGGTSKNYLNEAEIRDLNLMVAMYLDAATLPASRRQVMTWSESDRVLDRFLAGNPLPRLDGGAVGSATAATNQRMIDQRYAAAGASRLDGQGFEAVVPKHRGAKSGRRLAPRARGAWRVP